MSGIKVTLTEDGKRDARRFYMDPQGDVLLEAVLAHEADTLARGLVVVLEWYATRQDTEIGRRLRQALGTLVRE